MGAIFDADSESWLIRILCVHVLLMATGQLYAVSQRSEVLRANFILLDDTVGRSINRGIHCSSK